MAIGELEGIEMGKKWVEERKTEDLWVGRRPKRVPEGWGFALEFGFYL